MRPFVVPAQERRMARGWVGGGRHRVRGSSCASAATLGGALPPLVLSST